MKIKEIWNKIHPNLSPAQSMILFEATHLGKKYDLKKLRVQLSTELNDLQKKVKELGENQISISEFFNYFAAQPDYIENLENAIIYAQELYYSGQSVIDDSIYDLLIEELEKLDPNNALLTEVGSSAEVGVLITHNIMMGSLNKATKVEDIIEWFRIIEQNYKGIYVVQPKADGASIEVQYEKGYFKNASTRGGGITGKDISFNVIRMQGFKKKIRSNFTGSIRFEVVMKHDIFNSKYIQFMKNPRNAAAGIMMTKNHKTHSDPADLSLIAFDVHDQNNLFQFQTEKVDFLEKEGFEFVNTKIMSNSKEVINYRTELSKSSEKIISGKKVLIKERDRFGYDIDGIVVKVNDVDFEDSQLPKPKKQIAVKFAPEIGIGILAAINWSESASIYTPVAYLDPGVMIGGSLITNPNIANHSKLEELNLMIGNKVIVSKRGDIIPKIESVYQRHPTDTPIIYPTRCHTCRSSLIKTKNKIYCPNPFCDKKKYFRILNWKEKTSMLGFAEFLIKQLFDRGFATRIADLYDSNKVNLKNLISLDRVSTPLAKKVLEEIEKTKLKPMRIPSFIDGFNIEGIGESAIESYIVKGYDTLDKLRTINDGSGRADLITSKDYGLNFKPLWDDMQDTLKYIRLEVATPTADKLKGLTFVITGELPYKREVYKKFITNYQGKVSDSPSKNTKALITEETTMTGKRKKAEAANVPIWDIQEFKDFLIGEKNFSDSEIEAEWLAIASNN